MKPHRLPVRKHPTLLIAVNNRLVGDTYIEIEKGPAMSTIMRSGYELHQIGVMRDGKLWAFAFVEMAPTDRLPEMKPVPMDVARYALHDLPARPAPTKAAA